MTTFVLILGVYYMALGVRDKSLSLIVIGGLLLGMFTRLSA